MSFLDIIIVIFVLIGFLLGFKDGFIRKIIGLAGFALGIYLAIKFADPLGREFEEFTGIEFYLSQILAGFIIFLSVMIFTSIIKRIVHPHDKVNNIINQLFGGAFGAVQIIFFLSALFYILNIFDVPDEDTAENSYFYNSVYAVIPNTIDYVGNYEENSKEIIKEYIKEKDSVNVKDSI